MDSQKLENMLNLALNATEEERAESVNLNVGYNPIDREWDLIIKYSGSLDAVREISVSVVELLNEYAIIRIVENNIPALTQIPQVEYVEKPKLLVAAVGDGRRVSCVTPVQSDPNLALYGNGVLIAIIDSGIDYTNKDFRNPNGSTRIRELWDQSIDGNPPPGYARGSIYTAAQINQAIAEPSKMAQLAIVPSEDISGHGTAVAGIAAGNGSNSAGQYAGIAPQSELLIVKLAVPQQDGFPRTTELMEGIDYAIRKSLEYQMPLSVNLSFGNTYGSHDGTSLLERFIDDISNMGRTCICVGSGNEASGAGHTSGRLTVGQPVEIELAIQENQTTISVQIWKEYIDVVDISLVAPSGVSVGPLQEILGPQRFAAGTTEVLLYYGEPSPYSVTQEIYIDLLPIRSYIDSGIWRIILTPRSIVEGNYYLWLPSTSVLNVGTGFLLPQDTTTLTIPSTAGRVITVGAYDALTFSYASFSGRGYTRRFDMVKPDLVAPGVNVHTTDTSGGYADFTGTSFAAPFVTGSAALLMEWGIVRRNDIYLYGEKVKAYLRRGAKPLDGFTEYPNPQVGFGALCLRDSLPV